MDGVPEAIAQATEGVQDPRLFESMMGRRYGSRRWCRASHDQI